MIAGFVGKMDEEQPTSGSFPWESLGVFALVVCLMLFPGIVYLVCLTAVLLAIMICCIPLLVSITLRRQQ